jgi:hypothetical protein
MWNVHKLGSSAAQNDGEMESAVLEIVNVVYSKSLTKHVRTRTGRCRPLLVGALVAAVMGFASSASAATITIGLDFEFSGATAPSSATTPWVTIILDDSFGNANTVRMTVEATNLSGGSQGESINSFLLNFDPLLDVTQLTFTAIDIADSSPNAINTGTNTFRAAGDGFFDIEFDMPPPPGSSASRFTDGETITYDLIYTSAISASSFDFMSVNGGGVGTFSAAAHIQRINVNDSGWIGPTPIPEPSVAVLFGLGVMGLGWRRPAR